jgi:hypothetical protein
MDRKEKRREGKKKFFRRARKGVKIGRFHRAGGERVKGFLLSLIYCFSFTFLCLQFSNVS